MFAISESIKFTFCSIFSWKIVHKRVHAINSNSEICLSKNFFSCSRFFCFCSSVFIFSFDIFQSCIILSIVLCKSSKVFIVLLFS